MKKIIKAIVNTVIFLLGGKGEIAEEAVKLGLCNYEGQK